MKKTKNNIVAAGLGEVLFDHDVETGQLTFGGAPANFADHFLKCAELVFGRGRAEVHVVSAIGVDEQGVPDERGGRVLAELRERGLRADLARVKDLPTGIVDKTRDADGVNTYEIHPGAWDEIVWSSGLQRLARCCDVVCFGSLAQRSGTSHETVCRFLDEMIASERPTCRVFDVNIRQTYYSQQVLTDSLSRCNILKISDDEAPAVFECLTGASLTGDAGDFCRSLFERFDNLNTVILTEGGKGSRIFTRHRVSEYVISDAERRTPVDTVGAGDSFTAAFCVLLAAGRDMGQAQRFASRVAAFVCGCESATPCYPETARTDFLE